MDPAVPQRQRQRAAGLERLRLYTRRIVFGTGALVVALSVLAAQSIPGHAGAQAGSTGTTGTSSSSGQTQSPAQTTQQPGTQANNGSFGSGSFGSGGGAPITVTGGS